MGFRFWRRIGLAPGITLNLSKSGGSLSFGPHGARFTIGPRGVRGTVGIPGTGLFYTVQGLSGGGSRKKKPSKHTSPEPYQHSPGFLENIGRKLVGWGAKRQAQPRSSEERALADGVKALSGGDEITALNNLEKAAKLPDAAWLLGVLLLKHQRPSDAEHHLSFALEHSQSLGSLFERLGVAPTVTLGITPEVSAHLRPSEHGTLLALVETYQRERRLSEAMKCLDRLLSLDPSDPVVILSSVELTLDDPGEEPARKVVSLTSSVMNETPIHTAILLYKGRALIRLSFSAAAVSTFTSALHPREDRPQDLLRQITYERALAYDLIGRKADLRRELEGLYAEAPDFEDVGARLGLTGASPSSTSLPGAFLISELAYQIETEKPKGWEFKLTAELLRTNVGPIVDQWHRLEPGLYTEKRGTSGREDVLNWCRARVEELPRICGALGTLVNERLQASWGPPGLPGDANKIKSVCLELTTCAGQILAWEERARFTTLPKECAELQRLLSGVAGPILDQLAKISGEIARIFQQDKPSGAYKLELVLRTPDHWEEQFKSALARAAKFLTET